MDCKHSAEIKLLDDRLRAFQAENALLGRALRTAQAERQAQQKELTACQAESLETRRQFHAKDKSISALQRQVEELRVAAVKRDQHLQQSLVQRQELEGLVLDLQTQLSQFTGGRQDCASPGRARAPGGRDQAASPTLSRRPGQLLGSPRRGVGERAGSPMGKGSQAIQGPHASADLRDEIARLEELYSAKLQLVQQQAEARVGEVQRRHSEAAAAAQSAAREALGQLREEVQRQVEETENGLQRQLQQQDRVLEQLQKRCTALEARLREAKAAAASAAASSATLPTSALQQRHLPPPGLGREGHGTADMKPELAMLRRQLIAAQAGQQQTVATVDAAAVALATHKHQAADSMRRLHHVRQELCSALEQQHQLTSDNAQLQQQALAATAQLQAAEAAIRDLRGALCDAREKLLAAQATTVTEALQLAAQGVQQSGPGTGHKDTGPAATYVRVLEHALREADSREAALKRAVSEGQYLEDQARKLLATSRDEQLSMRKVLVQQVHRVQAMEAIRLSDAREVAQAWASQAANAAL